MAEVFNLELSYEELYKICLTKIPEIKDEEYEYVIEDLYNIYDNKFLECINEISTFPAKRGDILEICCISGYRNDGLLIYNGNKWIHLYYGDDEDHGAVPPEFKGILEFPINYWQNIITHNLYIYVSFPPEIIISENIFSERIENNILKIDRYVIHFCDEDIGHYDKILKKGLFQYSQDNDYTLYSSNYEI